MCTTVSNQPAELKPIAESFVVHFDSRLEEETARHPRLSPRLRK
jgi:hypothetical protein